MIAPLLKRRRGAALVLAMLVMLVLSGLALVALYSVTDSVWQSGSYRARTQAELFSDGVLTFALYRAGEQAPEELNKMSFFSQRELAEMDPADRAQALRRGGYHISTTGGDGSTKTNLSEVFSDGFFAPDVPTGSKSLETAPGSPVAYRYIMRDPLDGRTAEGFSRNFCYKKVALASQARVGNFAQTDARSVVSMGSHLVETLLGPVDCGSR
jgi:hypothetical protein